MRNSRKTSRWVVVMVLLLFISTFAVCLCVAYQRGYKDATKQNRKVDEVPYNSPIHRRKFKPLKRKRSRAIVSTEKCGIFSRSILYYCGWSQTDLAL